MKRAGKVWRELGPLLKEQRKARKRTQGWVARALQITVPAVSLIEAGRRDLRVSEFVALCCALGVRASVMLGSVESDPR